MGSPVSPIMANLYMESFEHRAITTAVNPPRIWKRYVDDTFVIQQQSNREELLQHINSMDPSIIFTAEETDLMVLCLSWTHCYSTNIWNPSNQYV